MTRKRARLNMLSFFYLVLMLAVWLGWRIETDRQLRRDGELFQQELQAEGMSAAQAFNIRQAMGQAYDHATSYASMEIVIVIICTQSMFSILIASIPEENHDAA